jgi:hypothetical protein
VTSDGVVGDTETALVMRLMEPHVDPSAVLLVACLEDVSGALLQEGVADLPIDMLLLEDILICEVNLPVEVLKAGSLAEAHKLVVDETILDVVELVDVLHNFLTLFLYNKVLDKIVSANGNPKSNVAVIYKGLGGEQGTEVCEGGISSEQRCAAVCASAAEIPLTTRILVLSLRSRPASSRRTCLMSESTSSATESLDLM